MKFLTKLGQILRKGVEIYTGIAPVVSGMFPGTAGAVQTVSQDLAEIAGIVTTVEVIGQTLNQPGSQKLVAATPLVAQVILKSSILANHKIADPVLFQAGCQKIADGMADVMNSLHDDIETVNKKT